MHNEKSKNIELGDKNSSEIPWNSPSEVVNLQGRIKGRR